MIGAFFAVSMVVGVLSFAAFWEGGGIASLLVGHPLQTQKSH